MDANQNRDFGTSRVVQKSGHVGRRIFYPERKIYRAESARDLPMTRLIKSEEVMRMSFEDLRGPETLANLPGWARAADSIFSRRRRARNGLAGVDGASHAAGPMKPPPLAQETLRRVLRMARFDGLGLVIVAGLAAPVSLMFGDLMGFMFSVLVVAGGLMELSGRTLLVRGDINGLRRLERSQLLVLTVIVVYCARQLFSFDLETTMGQLTPYSTTLGEFGVDLAPLLPLIRAYLPIGMYTLYGLVAFVTLLYQGGMVLYYRRRAAAVTEALKARLTPLIPPPVVPPQTGPRPEPEDLLT
ncbi:MAG: hypothetical protein JWM32_95 [Verrucomicrobia bacterium]|nr:hypothetical protein [Verrucomicrobiota bacterium]